MRAPATCCAPSRAIERRGAGRCFVLACRSAIVALAPMAPRTASPTDVPICRGRVEHRRGRAGDTCRHVAHRKVSESRNERPEPCSGQQIAGGRQGERRGWAGSREGSDAGGGEHASAADDGDGGEAPLEAPGQLRHEQERRIHEQPRKPCPQHRPADNVLVQQADVEKRGTEGHIAEQVNGGRDREAARPKQLRRHHGVRRAPLPNREGHEEAHSEDERAPTPSPSSRDGTRPQSSRASRPPSRPR